MLMGGGLKVIIIITVTLYFNAFLPVRISVHRRTWVWVGTPPVSVQLGRILL